MKIIYLSAANLGDRFFFKDFAHRFAFKEPVVVLHEAHPGGLATTRMATKRISALLSEGMVHNNAFSGDQRAMFRQEGSTWKVNTAAIQSLLEVVPVVVLGPVAASDAGPLLVSGTQLAHLVRSLFEADLICFADNPLSPLSSRKIFLDDEKERDRLLGLYEEERAAIVRAYDLRPVWLAGPANFAT